MDPELVRTDTGLLDDHPPTANFHVVGVGASAGGLEALGAFFRAMPLESNAAFVVVQHLSPDFKSHMEQLLSRETQIPIHLVEDQMEVEPNSIYLIPSKKEMIISDGKLLLTDKDPKSLAHPIDQFFRSLANDRGKRAIAVVLSGTGSDGSRGVGDVHEAGGLVISQSEETAKFDGMPRSAQKTGAVDVILPPEQMAESITTYIRDSMKPEQLAEDRISRDQLEGVQRVFQLLRAEFGLDFSHYKPATIARRVNRRVELNGYDDLPSYIQRLQDDRDELNDLYRDLLIGVTRFFRDGDAFEKLEQQVVPAIIEKTAGGEQIRVWVAGCATGEEAYSLAILFHEQLTAQGRPLNFKMFATDVHRSSIQTAANGIYAPDTLAEVSAARRSRYFREKPDGFHVIPELRRMIVFAPHNIISDAPFTQLDLVTCRNLLIYLQTAAQKKALSLFHFALKTGGTLMLGPSETPGEISDEFDAVDQRWKIYLKRRDVRLPPEMRLPLAISPQLPRGSTPPSSSAANFDNRLLAVYDRLLEQHMPPSFLVDENFELIHTFGGAHHYLQPRGGRTTTNILDLVHPDLRNSLSGALQHALKEDANVRYSQLSLAETADQTDQLNLIVQPLHDPRTKVLHLLVKLESVSPPSHEIVAIDDEFSLDEATRERLQSLELELRYTRENLQATIEELETANEELQATNEELVASNEELQSTNEELHSVNEELYTVNTEHQKKIEELTEANNDMDNLLATTRVGVIFLDLDLCIRRFTPEMARVLDLLPHDVGRRIDSFTQHLASDEVLEQLCRVRDTTEEIETEVVARNGQTYLMRILPYQTREGVNGLVLALIDIDTLRKAQAEIERFKFMSEHAADMHLLFDAEGQVEYANEAVQKLLRHDSSQMSRMTAADIDPELNSTRFQQLCTRVMDGPAERFETQLEICGGGAVPAELTVNAVRFQDQTYLFATARDISQRKQHEHALRESEQFLRRTLDSLFAFAAVCTPDGTLIEANRAALTAANLEAAAVLGKRFHETFWWSYSPQAQSRIQNAMQRAAAGETVRFDVDICVAADHRTPIDFQITPMRDAEGKVTHLVPSGIDISERQRAEDRLATEHAVTHILAEESAIESAVSRILNSFMENLAIDVAEFWRLDENLDRLRLAHHYVSEAVPDAAEWSAYRRTAKLSRGQGLAGMVWELGQPAWRREVAEELGQSPGLLSSSGIQTAFAIPVEGTDQFFGALCFFTRQSLAADEQLLKMLTAVGKEMGQFCSRVRSEAALRLRDRAIATATNGIVISDATSKNCPIVYVNRGFEQITGFSAAEAIGRNCRFLQGPATGQEAVQAIRQAIRKRQECRVTLANYKKDGSLFWNDLHITPVQNDAGRVTHFIGIQTDATSRKRVEERLRAAEQKATAASEAKTAFLANVSHELRTPLTAILGFADILLHRLQDEEDRDSAETIRRNGAYLLELVNDILDLSKVEADRLDVRTAQCDLPELVADVQKLMSVRADQSGIPLHVRYDSKIPRQVCTDRTRLRQILVNLLSNAIKFTEEGQVELIVQCDSADGDDNRGALLFKVADTGIGMTVQTQAKLFRPFSQADFDVTQRFGGTGLGLSISKRLADRLGGELSVVSTPGAGSTFTFLLPLDERCDDQDFLDPKEIPQPLAAAATESQRLACRVLVADDRRDVWRVCKYFLEAAGAVIEIAEDGRQVLDLVGKSQQEGDQFDLILMDMQMPVMTGYEATRELRSGGFQPPIIALTAGAMKGDRQKCLAAGCTDYFAKPIDGPKLVQLVSRLVHQMATQNPHDS